MMKKMTVMFFVFSSLVISSVESNSKESLASSDSGVSILPLQKITSIPKDLKTTWLKQHEEQKEKGYFYELTPRPYELINMRHNIAAHYKKYELNTNPQSTHMRHKIDEIHMAYLFKEVPQSEVSHVIGFAPVGGYSHGWTGAVEFFDVSTLGSCAYTENNMKLSHGAEKVAQELATNEINGKVTTLEVKGSSSSGYLYTIYWSDNEYFRQLECANMKYSKNITERVIQLAKRIDS